MNRDPNSRSNFRKYSHLGVAGTIWKLPPMFMFTEIALLEQIQKTVSYQTEYLVYLNKTIVMQYDHYHMSSSHTTACRRCSNYIFILDLTPGFKGLGKDDFKTRWESFKFWYLVRLILEILRYITLNFRGQMSRSSSSSSSYCSWIVQDMGSVTEIQHFNVMLFMWLSVCPYVCVYFLSVSMLHATAS